MVDIATGQGNANARMQNDFALRREFPVAGPSESDRAAHPTFLNPSSQGLFHLHEGAIQRRSDHKHGEMRQVERTIKNTGDRHGAAQFHKSVNLLRDVRDAEAKPAHDAQRRRNRT